MKNVPALLVLVATLTTASMASASSFYIDCSNPTGTVVYQSGHQDTQVTLTQSKWNGHQKVVSKIVLGDDKFTLEKLTSKVLSEKSTGGCDKESQIGYSSSTTVNYETVRIERENGGLFPADVSGVTRDRKAIEANMICQTEISNQMPCE